MHLTRRRKFQFFALLILTIIASFAEVLSLGLLLPFLGALTNPITVFHNKYFFVFFQIFNIDSPNKLLLPLTIFFSIAILISGLIRFLLLWAQTRLSYAVGADFSFSIYRKTLFQPYSVHVSRNSSEIISTISGKVNAITLQTIIPTLLVISSLLMLLMVLVAIICINPFVAIYSILGFGFIYSAILYFTKRRISDESKVISLESNNVIKALQEGLGGIRDVLLDGTQETFSEIYRKADSPLRKAQSYVTIIASSPRFGVESLGMILISGLAYYLAIKPEGLSTAIPVLGALALGAQRLLPLLQQLYSSIITINSGQQSLLDVLSLLDQKIESNNYVKSTSLIPFKDSIRFEKVSFRYSESGLWILKNLTFEIKKGARIGIIGTTGSGKSTILDIIMGLLLPNQGSLMIDDQVISSRNIREWQLHIAHVPQVIFLADSTIAENIAFGVPKSEIDFERVKNAAQKAMIADTIETWDKQYNSLVGEGGVKLSGGQRQRIGIARSFYKNADVLIFDEATSALDTTTENQIMSSINNLERDLTVIIVAHRLTTLKMCDFIINLEKGEIQNICSYDQILNL
jgi:ATP-binding cassette subfamily B protein